MEDGIKVTGCSCFSVNKKDNKIVYFSNTDKTIKILDPSGKEDNNNSAEVGFQINNLVWSPNGADLILTYRKYLIRFNMYIINYIDHPNNPKFCSYSPDGKMICCAIDQHLLVYDDELYILQDLQEHHKQNITAFCFSDDNKYIFSCSEDKTVKVIELEDYQIVTLNEFKCSITACSFSNNNFACALADKYIAVFGWNNKTLTISKVINVQEDKINQCNFINNNKTIICCSETDSVKQLTICDINTSVSFASEFNVGSQYLIQNDNLISCEDETIKAYNIATHILKDYDASVEKKRSEIKDSSSLSQSGSMDQILQTSKLTGFYQKISTVRDENNIEKQKYDT